MREAMVQYPSQTVAYADTFDLTDSSGAASRGYWAYGHAKPDSQYGVSSRHMDGTNVTFFDGHAKWYKTNRLINSVAPTKGTATAGGDDRETWSNYNLSGVIWDVDAANPMTNPTLHPLG